MKTLRCGGRLAAVRSTRLNAPSTCRGPRCRVIPAAGWLRTVGLSEGKAQVPADLLRIDLNAVCQGSCSLGVIPPTPTKRKVTDFSALVPVDLSVDVIEHMVSCAKELSSRACEDLRRFLSEPLPVSGA